MYKLLSFASVTVALSACATTSTEPAAVATVPTVAAETPGPAGSQSALSGEPVKTVDLMTFKEAETRCEDLTRPGSRIVVARRCRQIDEDALAEQLDQVRREQETLDRRSARTRARESPALRFAATPPLRVRRGGSAVPRAAVSSETA
jgi:hypothetical protein